MRETDFVPIRSIPEETKIFLPSQAVVLEGKYWKRKLAAVTAEYKKWRMFYRNRIVGWTAKDGSPEMVSAHIQILFHQFCSVLPPSPKPYIHTVETQLSQRFTRLGFCNILLLAFLIK